jgi:hypothetical protein
LDQIEDALFLYRIESVQDFVLGEALRDQRRADLIQADRNVHFEAFRAQECDHGQFDFVGAGQLAFLSGRSADVRPIAIFINILSFA